MQYGEIMKIIDSSAECQDCGKEWNTLNAHILGAKHHKKTGHEVIVEVSYGAVYRRKG